MAQKLVSEVAGLPVTNIDVAPTLIKEISEGCRSAWEYGLGSVSSDDPYAHPKAVEIYAATVPTLQASRGGKRFEIFQLSKSKI